MTKRINQPFIATAAGVVFVTLSNVASAVSAGPSASCSTSSSCVTAQNTAATQLINTTTVQQMLTISNAISARTVSVMGPPPGVKTTDAGQRFGMAAGGAADKWNAWGSLAADRNRYNNGTNLLNADVGSAVFGADYALAPALSMGLSAAVDSIDGARSSTVFFSSSGYTLAPYLGWQISKDLSLDASMGWGDSDTTANDGTLDKNNRFFYGSNLTYTQWSGNWQIAAKGSYLHGEEDYKDQTTTAGATIANSATKNKVSQWRLGAQAAYWMNGVMPYVGLTYSSDSRTVSNPLPGTSDDLGKSAWLWSVGANIISVKNSLTGGIALNQETGRSNSKHYGLMANINYRF